MASKFPESLEDDLTCPICLEIYKDPRMLPCQHTYCKRCLETMFCDDEEVTFRYYERKARVIKCPECRETVQVRNVSSLQKNIWVNKSISRLETIKTDMAEIQSNKKVRLICNSCKGNKQATARCLDCERFVCDLCQANHHILEVSKGHQILSLEVIKRKGIPTRETPSICSIHKYKKQTLFCGICDLLICKSCADFEHKDHEMFLVDIIGSQRQKLKAKIEDVGCAKDSVLSSIKKVKDMRKRVETKSETVDKKIDATIDANIQILEKMRKCLKEEARAMQESKLKKLSEQQHRLEMQLTTLTDAIKFTQSIIEKEGCVDFLSMVEQVLARLHKLPEEDNAVRVTKEDGLDLQINNSVPCCHFENFLKVIDNADPDPKKCELCWHERRTVRLHVRDYQGEPVDMSRTRIHIDLPFHYELDADTSTTGLFVIKGSFLCPEERSRTSSHSIYYMKVFVDGYQVKGSPLQVVRQGTEPTAASATAEIRYRRNDVPMGLYGLPTRTYGVSDISHYL